MTDRQGRRSGVPTPKQLGLRTSTLIGRALQLRCPVCGCGHLFRRWVSMVDRCPRCDLRFEREPGAFVGSVGLNTVVTFSLLFAVLLAGGIAAGFGADVGGLILPAAAFAALFPLLFHPFSKTLWLAADLLMAPLRPEEARGATRQEYNDSISDA